MEAKALDKLFAKRNLKAIAPDVRSLLKASIRLDAFPVAPAGPSHLGGAPDLPDGYPWPAWKGKPMSFVAQVRLEDIHALPPAQDFPAGGLLAFFYDAAQETYGDAPADRGGWSVVYFDPAVQLKPAAFPADLPTGARFSPLTLRPKTEWTLPASGQQGNPNLHWNDKNVKNYEALLQDFPGPGDHTPPFHRMAGWPDQIQEDMQLQAALMFNGITLSSDPRAQAAEAAKLDWQLLLQVDSDDRAGMRWGSAGMIYYWIQLQDLRSRRFDRTWLVLQSD